MKKFKVKRCKPKVRQLEEMFGGRWKYNGMSTWSCLDGKRMVWAVASCSCDFDCGSSPRYYLYGDGTPQEVHFKGQAFNLCTEMRF